MAGLNQVPASLEPIGTFGGADVPVSVASVWYQFFQSLSSIVGNIVGGVLGFTLDGSVTAAGTVQADATELTTEWSAVTVTPINSGVVLNDFGAGVPQTVFNLGAHTLKIYPFAGAQVDALGANAAYLLASNKMQVFSQTGDTQFQSMQLG